MLPRFAVVLLSAVYAVFTPLAHAMTPQEPAAAPFTIDPLAGAKKIVPRITEDERAERMRLFQEWHTATQALASYCEMRQSKDKRERKTAEAEAEDCRVVMRFLREGSVLSMPVADPETRGLSVVRISAPPKDSRSFLIIPLTREDIATGAPWEELATGSRRMAITYEGSGPTASDGRPYPFIIIKTTVAVSRFWRGLVLFHEGNLAFMYAHGLYDDIRNAADRDAVIHARAYLAKLRLLEAIGGERYLRLVDEEKTWQLVSFTKTDTITFRVMSPTTRAGLDDVFGPAASDDEQALRSTAFTLHAAIRAFRVLTPAGSDQYHALVHSLFRALLQKGEEPDAVSHQQ